MPMLDNEQVVANLANDTWAYYYSMGHRSEVIREVHRNASGKLFIRFPNWGLVPLGKDSPEVLIGKVPTSLELTTRISNLELSARYLKDVVALTREKVEQEYFAQLEKLEIERNDLKLDVERLEVMLDELDRLRVERDALKVELHKLKAKVSKWAINHAWMLEEVEPKEDMDKINRFISPPEGISISEWCKRTHIQLCHCCDDLTCDDNLRKELKEKENEPER
jgi:hypothetical protein